MTPSTTDTDPITSFAERLDTAAAHATLDVPTTRPDDDVGAVLAGLRGRRFQSADAVGTQTEALVVRGLSVGVGIRSIALREALTGLLLGALLGSLMFGTIALVWGDLAVASAVAVAVLAASAIATVVAMALPWLLQRLGGDPAFGSGPLATIIQDLLSIVIYFAVVALLVT